MVITILLLFVASVGIVSLGTYAQERYGPLWGGLVFFSLLIWGMFLAMSLMVTYVSKDESYTKPIVIEKVYRDKNSNFEVFEVK
jgi:hypothetical protein